jgi:hypothetical protein
LCEERDERASVHIISVEVETAARASRYVERAIVQEVSRPSRHRRHI